MILMTDSTKISMVAATPPQTENANLEVGNNVYSLAAVWARNYYATVTTEVQDNACDPQDIQEILSAAGRQKTAESLLQHLTSASARAWTKVEDLLAESIQSHGIDRKLIDPWEIAADIRQLYEKMLEAYGDCATPQTIVTLIGREFGLARQKYTASDPRAIGVVSMKFHYTGELLLELLSPLERKMISPYLKVMDDHMYMPLRSAYEAAAQHSLDSPALLAVQEFLPMTSEIARAVCDRVQKQHPAYQSYSGSLETPAVKQSSIRDVEMFQVYLCLCVLQDSIRSVQQELFPLCVMLYPRLQVSWKLVQDMLLALFWQVHDRMPPERMMVFLPYLRTFTEMFADEVFARNS